MKKRILSMLMAMLLTFSAASAAFSDISDTRLEQTASVLDALGIMQGVGNNQFDPSSSLTRAQFCKLAVTSMGLSDVSAYGSYTIFPDVKNSHWAAPYINAAVRHPDLKDRKIIRGYADGTFGPNKTVNFGEACTMLLRMLGYQETDIGPFWPQDYIARAKSLGLTDNVSDVKDTGAVKRSDAALMLLNTLGATPKEGDILLKKVASGTVENSVLLATSETNGKLRSGMALFYEDGNVQQRSTIGTLDKSMIGISGTVVFDKKNSAVAIGIVPNHNKVEVVSVRTAAANGVTTESGVIRPDRNTKLYTGEITEPKTYAESWADITSGSKLHLFYDSYGQLALMAVLPTGATANAHSFVYGLESSVNIPQNYAVVKNGVTIDRTKLQKYDVVTLDAANQKAIVTDTRLSGYYGEGTPTFSYPQQVTMYDESYAISDSAAATFKNIKLGDYITLLFDANGGVVAAYPKSVVSAEMQGIVTGINGKQTTILMTNGLTIRPTCEAEDLTAFMGRLVTVGQSSGKTYLTKRSLSGKTSGSWTIADGKIGTAQVSPTIKVYEEVISGAPLNLISISDIKLSSVSSGQIKYTVSDNAGTITNIVLGDVTGESWVYGIGYGEKKQGEYVPPLDEHSAGSFNYLYLVKLDYWEDGKNTAATYPVVSLPSAAWGNPVGIPKGYSTSVKNPSLDTLPLKLVDTVEVSAFDGSVGVKTSDGYYELADEIGVYVTAQQQFISLQSAKTNYTKFRLYANNTASNGGKIRVIIAS